MIKNILCFILASNLSLAQIETFMPEQPEIIQVNSQKDDPFYSLYEKDYKTALSKFNELLQESPFYSAALMGKAKCLFELARTEEAFNTYKIVYHKNPLNVAALEGLGKSAFYLEDFSNAINFYQKALAITPKNPSLYEGLSKVFLCQRQFEPALKNARIAERYIGKDESKTALIFIITYLALTELQDTDALKSIKKNTQSIKKNPSWPTPVINYFNGELTGPELLSYVETYEEEIQAHTYIGLKEQNSSDPSSNIRHLKWVCGLKSPKIFETILAKYLISAPSA